MLRARSAMQEKKKSSNLPQPDTWKLSADFNWQEFCNGQLNHLELFLVFGDGCNLATFLLPTRMFFFV